MLADRHWGKGAFGALAKYWHFASTTCRRCLQLAGRVYLWCTVSTDPKPPSPCVLVNDGSGPSLGEGGRRPPSQILARVVQCIFHSTPPGPPLHEPPCCWWQEAHSICSRSHGAPVPHHRTWPQSQGSHKACACYAPSMRPLCALYAPSMCPLCALYVPSMRQPIP